MKFTYVKYKSLFYASYLPLQAKINFPINSVAQSLHHDHEPAGKLGLQSVWVDRSSVREEVDEKTTASFGWEVKSLGELAGLAEEAFAKEEKM